MKIVVDKIPEEGVKCMFGRREYFGGGFIVRCRADGCLCDLEQDDHCEKLITLEDLNNGRD